MNFMRSMILATAAVALSALPTLAQEMPIEGPVPTSALISIDTKNGAQLDPSQLRLQLNRHAEPITSVRPIAPAATQIAILIDDGLRQSFDLQLNDIKSFIQQLPQGTQVLIGYMQNGEVRSTGQFNADHNEVLSALRIPFSGAGVDASPYFALSTFVKNWPSRQPAARFVLLITNGIDPYNGRPSVLNQDSPYVQTAQEDAQRAGTAVYSIYFGQQGMRGGSFSGQSYLTQVGDATGGQSLYQGTFNPVTIAPYLAQFSKYIRESYTVNFLASTGRDKRDTLTQIKITSSQPGIKVHGPQGVHPGVVD